jgi:hypothetical protein
MLQGNDAFPSALATRVTTSPDCRPGHFAFGLFNRAVRRYKQMLFSVWACQGPEVGRTTYRFSVLNSIAILNLTYHGSEDAMTSPKKSGPEIEVHPLLSRLLSEGADACVFRGYVGPSERADFIRLYPSLGFLNFSVEIGLKDIVETAPAPTTMLPYNGTVVWVRNDAEVVFHGDSVTTVPVRSLRRTAPATPIADTSTISERSDASNYIDIVRGRLRMTVPVVRVGAYDVCASCRGCASCTSVCQSGLA